MGNIESLSWAMKMKMKMKMMRVLVLILVVAGGGDGAAPSAAQCQLEKKLGVTACTPILYGNPPSGACCERIRVTHIECVCPVITPQMAALVNHNINRFIRIIQGCGRPVPRHFKCGSITTP